MPFEEAWLVALVDLDTIEAYERGFAAAYGVRHVLATNSGSAAYLAALLSLRLPRSRRVLVPAYSWPQLVTVPEALGYRVSFADTDAHGRIDVDRLEARLTPAVGALVVCHLFGNPNDMVAAVLLARRYGVAIIEDCSQALYASVRGCSVGRWGDMAFCSTGMGKTLYTGEGGLLWTDHAGLYRRAFAVTQHGDRATDSRLEAQTVVNSLSLRIHPAGAAQGLAALADLRARVSQRTAQNEQARVLLARLPDVTLPEVCPGCKATWTHCPLLLRKQGESLLAPYLWSKRPAYLLTEAPHCKRARAFSQSVDFLHLEEGNADERLASLAAAVFGRCC